MRRAAKRDQNEAAIVEALEQVGIVVYRLSAPGLPDLLTYWRGIWQVLEVKMPGECLTPDQERVRAQTWFPIVTTSRDALMVFGLGS